MPINHCVYKAISWKSEIKKELSKQWQFLSTKQKAKSDCQDDDKSAQRIEHTSRVTTGILMETSLHSPTGILTQHEEDAEYPAAYVARKILYASFHKISQDR